MKLTDTSIRQHLKNPSLSFEIYDSIPSTNTLLKQRGREGSPEGLVIAAEAQTAGRGRMGRSFFSPADTGIYFSVLLRPTLPPSDCLLITTAAAVACAQVLDQYAEEPVQIKWVNDLYVGGRKVCGILTEAAVASPEAMNYVVLGIGINITPPKHGFPAEIVNRAGSVLQGETMDLRGKIMAEVLDTFFSMYENIEKREYIPVYQSRSMLNGQAIDVIKNDHAIPAQALYVDDNLSLVVRYSDGTVEHLSTGDVSVKTL